jgi:hypothetical protein
MPGKLLDLSSEVDMVLVSFSQAHHPHFRSIFMLIPIASVFIFHQKE